MVDLAENATLRLREGGDAGGRVVAVVEGDGVGGEGVRKISEHDGLCENNDRSVLVQSVAQDGAAP